MNYELAKKLKEAGFPQSKNPLSKYFINDGKEFFYFGLEGGSPADNIYYSPTLSELIEACMDFYYPCHFNIGGMNTWWAVIRNEKNNEALIPVQTGPTPEYAVANLWLELNKKNEQTRS